MLYHTGSRRHVIFTGHDAQESCLSMKERRKVEGGWAWFCGCSRQALPRLFQLREAQSCACSVKYGAFAELDDRLKVCGVCMNWYFELCAIPASSPLGPPTFQVAGHGMRWKLKLLHRGFHGN